MAAHRWAGIAKQRVESIGLSDAPSEVAVFVRAAAEALALSAGQAERGTFARAAAETLALAATHTGGIAAPGINPATDWASRSASAKGVIGAENWSSYADAAAAYNSAGCYGANKNPSQGATFTNAFEIVTDAGHVLSGKALRLWTGKNGYGGAGTIDNQYWIMPFNLNKAALAAAFRKKIYIQWISWADAAIDYLWKLPDGTAGSMKELIVDTHDATATVGEVVAANQLCFGFPTVYRKTAGESSALLERTRSGTGLAGSPNYQLQNACDRGTPSSPTTQAQWEQRYGAFNYGTTSGSSQASLLSTQNVPDPDASIGGVPYNRGGLTAHLLEMDLAADRLRYWVASYGNDPVLCGDSSLDDTAGNTAGFGDRVKALGVGWNAVNFSNLMYSGGAAAGADNPGYPTNAYRDYPEIIFSEQYVDFPGGKTPPGISSLAQLARSMSSGDWQSFTMGNMNLTLLDAGGGKAITEFAARGHWDPVHKKIQYWGQGHYQTPKLITWDDATNQWTATANVPYTFTGSELGHAYYHLAMDPATGDIYLRRYGSGTVYKKPYGAAWTTVASHANLYNQVAGGLEWFPALNSGAGGLVFIDVGSAQSSNAAVSSWTTRQDPLSTLLGSYHNWIARAGSTMYFGGGNGSSTMYSMNASGTVSSAPSTPISAGISQGIVFSHPNGSDLLLFAQGTTGNIYRFSGGSWSGSIGTHQIGGNTDTWFGVTIPEYGVVLFVAQLSDTSNPTVKVYKP